MSFAITAADSYIVWVVASNLKTIPNRIDKLCASFFYAQLQYGFVRGYIETRLGERECRT